MKIWTKIIGIALLYCLSSYAMVAENQLVADLERLSLNTQPTLPRPNIAAVAEFSRIQAEVSSLFAGLRDQTLPAQNLWDRVNQVRSDYYGFLELADAQQVKIRRLLEKSTIEQKLNNLFAHVLLKVLEVILRNTVTARNLGTLASVRPALQEQLTTLTFHLNASILRCNDVDQNTRMLIQQRMQLITQELNN